MVSEIGDNAADLEREMDWLVNCILELFGALTWLGESLLQSGLSMLLSGVRNIVKRGVFRPLIWTRVLWCQGL